MTAKKTFHFSLHGHRNWKTLVTRFRPEVVVIRRRTYEGWEVFRWADVSTTDTEVRLHLPHGEYLVTVVGLPDPKEIEDEQRWEHEGGPAG